MLPIRPHDGPSVVIASDSSRNAGQAVVVNPNALTLNPLTCVRKRVIVNAFGSFEPVSNC